jgi:hypothetical protein
LGHLEVLAGKIAFWWRGIARFGSAGANEALYEKVASGRRDWAVLLTLRHNDCIVAAPGAYRPVFVGRFSLGALNIENSRVFGCF